MTWKLKFPFPNPDLAHCEQVSSAPSSSEKTYVAEMVAGSNGARGALALSHREELLESAGTRNRWLVRAGVSADLISAAIRLEGAEALGSAARVVIAVVLHDVVLGLRRVDPAVDGEVGA